MVKLHNNIKIKLEPIENPILNTSLTDLNEVIQNDFENEDIAANVPNFTFDNLNNIKCEPAVEFTLELPVDEENGSNLKDENFNEDDKSEKKNNAKLRYPATAVKRKFKDVSVENENMSNQASKKRITRSMCLRNTEKPPPKKTKSCKNSSKNVKNSETAVKSKDSSKVTVEKETKPSLSKISQKSAKNTPKLHQKITNFFHKGSKSESKDARKFENITEVKEVEDIIPKLNDTHIKTSPNHKLEAVDKQSRDLKDIKEQSGLKYSPPPEELQKNSQNIPYFECEICNLIFRTKNSLYLHKRSHKPRIECQICHKMIRRYNMTIHLKYHDDSKRKYKCDFCPMSFINRMSIQNHMYQHMKTKKFYCEICGRGYNDSRHLREHKLSHTTPLAYRCDLCPKGYERKQALEAHMHGSHMVDSPWYKCNICGYKTKLISVICSHKKRHNKNVPCDECGKKFASRNEMLDHKLAIHVNVKNVECKLCGKFFASLRYMKKHVRRTHADPNKFKCELCPKTFKCHEGLNQHFKKHFGKQINCEICKRSIKSTNLKQHLDTNMECREIRQKNEKKLKQKSKKK